MRQSSLVYALGIDYELVRLPDGGELFLTQLGRSLSEYLLPDRWFAGSKYKTLGKRLGFSTGTVYRVPLPGSPGRRSMVVKFSRFAEDVSAMLGIHESGTIVAQPRFPSPFEEVSLLDAMRQSPLGSPRARIRTKGALGIYCPPTRHPSWSLGRSEHEFAWARRRVQETSAGGVELHADRSYVVLFEWMRGENLQELVSRGAMPGEMALALSEQAVADMLEKGFRVVDHKPNHVIVRLRSDGRIPVRNRRVVYGIADFELLVPTDEFSRFLAPGTPRPDLRERFGWIVGHLSGDMARARSTRVDAA